MTDRLRRKSTAKPARRAGKSAAADPEALARKKIRRLWRTGALFHNSNRYPRRGPQVDRLAGILKHGIVSPAQCTDGSVSCNINVVMTGAAVPYDSLVFLHRYGPRSYIYTIYEPGRFAVFIDPKLPVLTPRQMGRNWCILCQDEVYVRDRVPVERLIGIAVHPADAESVLTEFIDDFRRLALPLYEYDGKVLWPATRSRTRNRRN